MHNSAYMDSKSSVSAQTDLESIIALTWIRIFSLDFMAYVDYMAYKPYTPKIQKGLVADDS